MFRSSVLRRLWATYAAVVLFTVLVTGVLLHSQLQGSLQRQLARSLEGQASRLATRAAELLDRGDRGPAAAELAELANQLELRITLLDGRGRVQLDSHGDAINLGDESRFVEVSQALADGRGRARRKSVLVGRDTLYEAQRLVRADGTVAGVLRLSVGLDSIAQQLAALRARLALGALAGTLAALLLALYVARRLTTPIKEMTRVAEALGSGDYGRRISQQRDDELGVLGATLNRLGDEITQRIATISNDDARLRAMLAAMVEGVIAVDQDDRVVFLNDAACQLLNLSAPEAIGRPMWQLLRTAELVRLLEEAHAKGHVVRREIQLQRGSREYTLDAHASPFDGGAATGLVIVLHDVTELRRLERVRRDFVANVSHELKTPLTSIKGYVETLLDGALEDSKNNVRFLEKIAVHVERLAHLVTDLLSLARIESQQGALPREPVDLDALVRKALKRYEEPARGKAVSLSLHGEREPVVVLGDPEALTQVVDNLLDNGIKYTTGGGAVSVRLERHNGVGRLSVTDSGIGIPEEDLERIFERFYRVDKARSREIGGTGLGLSIVKHLVQAMHGNVSVTSRLHEGSRFQVELPLARTPVVLRGVEALPPAKDAGSE